MNFLLPQGSVHGIHSEERPSLPVSQRDSSDHVGRRKLHSQRARDRTPKGTIFFLLGFTRDLLLGLGFWFSGLPMQNELDAIV